MTRDSLISSATSTTYPSTLSSFDNSALGLTDSPRHASSARSRPMSQPHQSLLSPAPLTSAAAGIAPPASPSLSPWRRRRTRTPGVEEADPASQGKHRPVPQSTALQDHPKMTAPPPVPRKYSHPSIRTSHSKSSFQVVSEGRKIEHKASSERVSQDQPRRTVRKQRSGLTEQSNTPTKTQALGVEPQNPRASTPEAKSASKDDDHRAHDSSGRSIAIPVRRQAQDYGQTAQTTPSKQKPARAAGVATPSHRLTQQDADDSLARQWESELLKAAGDLRLDHQGDNLRQHREELRRKDREWENSGTWESTQDAAKRAEERTRREASREIAYPPMQPRAPIRAAPSGVTSVHVGVRPRVHPSRVDESTNRNQPDPSVPVPLFLPSLSLPDPLPGEDTVKGSYNTRYTTELMDKARAEYEAWLGGKSEREGGIGDDQGGVGDFIPRNRHVALPKAVGGQTPMESWDEPRKTNKNGTSSDGSNRIATPLEGGFPWNGYGYLPDMIDPSQAFNGANMQIPPGWTQDDLARWYASQAAYWNPYWWSQAMQNPQVTESQQDEVSEVNKPAAGKVHFAESPDKTRLNPKSSAASLHQDYVDQGMYSDPANMMAFNPYMGMMGGAPGAGSYSNMGMGGPFDPRMSMIGQYPMMSGMGGPMPHAGGTPGVGPGSGAMNSDGSLKPFDSSQMKRGRMGHYGYLEGRELAGPPPGHLPAGMSPMYDQGLSTQGPTSQIMGSPTDTGSGTAPSSAGYYPQTAAGGATGRTGPKTSWGDPNVGPRARYDGTSATQQIVQADVDSPYPLTARGGVASAFTKYEGYGPERAAASGIDGRLGWAHRRTREGKV